MFHICLPLLHGEIHIKVTFSLIILKSWHSLRFCNEPIKERVLKSRLQVKRIVLDSQFKRLVWVQTRLNNLEPLSKSRQGSQRCQKCGNYGHNKRTCIVVVNI